MVASKKYRRRTEEEKRAEAQALQEQLVDQVARLADSDQWRRFLDFTARFRQYSLNNQLLILSQLPTATYVAGYSDWKKMGRHVRAGERGLQIFAYSPRKRVVIDEETGDEQTISFARFPVVKVFDISQTDLDEGRVDDNAIVELLTGADEHDIFGRTAELMRSQGWTVELGATSGGVNGFTTIDGSRRIVVGEHLEPAQQAKTMLHEAAHALLHSEQTAAEYHAHRGVAETEAESVAYVMAAMLGLDTTAYSIGYIAGWAKADTALIRATAANVLRAVETLSGALSEDLATAA